MTPEGCGNDGQPRLATAVEKWKSKDRIPTFPRLVTFSQNQNKKGDQSRPVTLVFRLIYELENARSQRGMSLTEC